MKQIVIAIVLALTTISAHADVGDIRITTLNNSYHFDSLPKDGPQYNEKHSGIGLEVGIDNYTWIGVLKFKNSFYEDSLMLKMNYERPINDDWHWGGMFGVADGYDWRPRKQKYMPFLGVTLRWKFIRLTVNPVVAAIGLVVKIK